MEGLPRGRSIGLSDQLTLASPSSVLELVEGAGMHSIERLELLEALNVHSISERGL